MSKSDLLRFHDVRDAFRLIGDCRDLGNDPDMWSRLAFQGLNGIIGGCAATGGEGVWIRPNEAARPMTSCDVGFDATSRRYFLAFMRDGCLHGDPIFQRLQHLTGRLETYDRREHVSDRDWYRSVAFNEYRKAGGIDHQLTSIYQVNEQGAISSICLHRSVGDRPFSPREQALMNCFHRELGRLIGGPLVSGIEPGPEQLSPRLRQTLLLL